MTPLSDPAPRLAALRYRDFRWMWGGDLVAIIGGQMQLFAINWHVFQLLRGQTVTLGGQVVLSADALGLGLLGLMRIGPIIVFALVGGLLADSRDRRRLLIITRILSGGLALPLAIITLGGGATVGLLYLVSAAAGGVTAFANPARQSLVPNLVPREHLANAISLNTLMWQVATIVGPALTGALIGAGGALTTTEGAALDRAAMNAHIGVVYVVSAAGFFIGTLALLRLQYRGGAPAASSGIGWQSLVEGLRFTFRSRIILSTMLLDFLATFFSSANTMLPIVAADVLGLDAAGYGLLATAQPIGAVIAGSVLALGKEIHRQGRVLLVSVAVYGLATALFGLSTAFVLSYLFYGLTGAGDTISTVIRGTIRQTMTPDYLRGRMTSVNMIFFMGGPQLGELEAGLVAAAFGAPFAIVSGGMATVLLTGVIAWKFPHLRAYTRVTAAQDLALAQAAESKRESE